MLQIQFCCLFLSIFVLYLYSRRAHKTRKHVFHCCRGMCAAIIREHMQCHTQTHTRRYRQQGHVAHNKDTLDSHLSQTLVSSSSSCSNPSSFSFFFCQGFLSFLSSLSPTCLLISHIYKFSYAQLRTLSAFPCRSPCLILPPTFLCSVPLMYSLTALSPLAFCLPYCCCGFLYCAVFSPFFVFRGSIYLYK